jgi:hypothetical protein
VISDPGNNEIPLGAFFSLKEKRFSIFYEDFEPILDQQTPDFHQISISTGERDACESK